MRSCNYLSLALTVRKQSYPTFFSGKPMGNQSARFVPHILSNPVRIMKDQRHLSLLICVYMMAGGYYNNELRFLGSEVE